MDPLTLPADELRVLGCLVEKQLTTPQQYPLTLNALTLACNQSSNRDPVMTLSEREVDAAVTSAKSQGLARFVHPSHGRSAIRFRHALDEALGLDVRQLALLAVLILRGPQTPGELRARTERMAEFSSLRDLEEEVEGLARRDTPLVERLARQPGQKEERYLHLLGDADAAVTAWSAPARPPHDARSGPAAGFERGGSTSGPVAPSTDATTAVTQAIEDLRAQVDEIRRDLAELRSQLGA